MSAHTATVRWSAAPDEEFIKGRYSRAHSWWFDGGAVVAASASPTIVPAPWSDAAAVDPEEAFVASVSSCHMLWFLDLARQSGLAIVSYDDEAQAKMERCDDGKARITQVMLRPVVGFAGDKPSAAIIDALHREAHDRCFMANSISAKVVIEYGL